LALNWRIAQKSAIILTGKIINIKGYIWLQDTVLNAKKKALNCQHQKFTKLVKVATWPKVSTRNAEQLFAQWCLKIMLKKQWKKAQQRPFKFKSSKILS